jgi:hypothetical protein
MTEGAPLMGVLPADGSTFRLSNAKTPEERQRRTGPAVHI